MKSRRIRWAGHAESKGESRNAYRILMGKPERKRTLGTPRHRWEIILRRILERQNGVVLIWLWTGTSGGLL
jgi:hypothetical protein